MRIKAPYTRVDYKTLKERILNCLEHNPSYVSAFFVLESLDMLHRPVDVERCLTDMVNDGTLEIHKHIGGGTIYGAYYRIKAHE